MSAFDYQNWLKEYTALTESVSDLHGQFMEASYKAKLSLSTAALRLIKESKWEIGAGTTAVWLCAASDEWAMDSHHPVIDALSYLFPHGEFSVISGKDAGGIEIVVCNINCSDGYWTLNGEYGERDGEWSYANCVEFIKQLNLDVDLSGARQPIEAEIKRVQGQIDNLSRQKAELTNRLNAMGG